MIKIGLDMSSSNTGYCIRKDEEIIEYGDINFKHKDFKVRCIEIVNQIKKLCQNNKVEFAMFEDIQTGKFSHASYVLSFLQGCLVYMLEQEKIAYCPVTINSWRKNAGIKSRKRDEQKQEALNLVNERYNINITCDDVAEAILLSEFNNFK